MIQTAALAASRWMGRGERTIAGGAAVETMRDALNEMDIAEAPMQDIAVDPVEGANLVANGLPNSIAVMAIAERGGLFHATDGDLAILIRSSTGTVRFIERVHRLGVKPHRRRPA